MSAATLFHKEFSELRHALGADEQLRIHGDGPVVHLDQRTGSKGALLGARFRIDLPQPIAPYTILLRHESGVDRAGKAMGINREVQIGDAAFDNEVYIETDGQDEDVRRLLGSAGVRDAVREIVTAKIESLTIGGELAIEGVDHAPSPNSLRVDFPPKAFRDVGALRQVLLALVRLSAEVARMEHGGPYRGDLVPNEIKPKTKDRTGRGLALFLVCVAVNLVGWWGVGLGVPPTFGWSAFSSGLLAGGPIWIALVFVSVLLLRGRSTSLRNVGIFAVCALPTIMASARVAEKLNAATDTSAPHEMQASVRLRPQSKGGPRREVTLLLTNDRVDVGAPHDQAVPFSYEPKAVVATVRDGAFGSPYLVSLRVAAR